MLGHLSNADRELIADANLDLTPVSLQQLVVRSTQADLAETSAAETDSRSLQS